MELEGRFAGLDTDYQGNTKISFNLAYKSIGNARKIAEGGAEKIISISVAAKRKKRSLTANAYMWALLEQIAQAVKSNKDEIYIQMLDRYGKFTHIIVKPVAVDSFVREWRTVRNLGEVTVNGATGIQLQCYFGSSTYDTKEMARLIDGIVSECKELGIETETIPLDWSQHEKHNAG
ncbi:MAG TPA: hypothetical protein DEQ02_05640 [Ruminococcaceae bacterium]|nr:hypothetical protein [Oscillospiraceae bacterium]